MAISEKMELLGKGLYKDIPDTLTLRALPTSSELEYVSADNFDETMINKILPKAVEEKIDFNKLLEVDYQWLLRCLRILNYGPYYTTNTIYCPNCGQLRGDYQVDLQNVECKPIPEGFKNEIVISRDEFLDFNGDVVVKLPTIRDILNAQKDSQFKDAEGNTNNTYARICYMVKSIGTQTHLTPVEVKMQLDKQFSAADYQVLKDSVRTLTDFGLRSGGQTVCPNCGSKDAIFFAMVDDRYFRPTLANLKSWKSDRRRGQENDAAGTQKNAVRENRG